MALPQATTETTLAKMIDINQPVPQGSDVVLNYKDGRQKLGSVDGFERELAAGRLENTAPNDNPEGDVNAPDSYGIEEPLNPLAEPTRKRDAKGHFVK